MVLVFVELLLTAVFLSACVSDRSGGATGACLPGNTGDNSVRGKEDNLRWREIKPDELSYNDLFDSMTPSCWL